MRVAFVHPHFPSAEGTGATHSATQIVRGLAEAGHELRVYCSSRPDGDVETSGVELRHLAGRSRHPHTNTRLNAEISARRDELREFDVLHSYLPSLLPSVAEVGKVTDVGTFLTLNAYGGTCAKNDLLYLDRAHCQRKSTTKCLNCIARSGVGGSGSYMYQTASQLFSLRLVNEGESRLEHVDGFRAPSGHVSDNYAEFGFPAERIHVIPHPLDERFLVEHESDFCEPIDLLYVGYLEHRKGVEKLIPILAGLRARGLDIRLTVVGDGSKRTKMERQANDAGIDEWVEFRGHVPNADLPPVYAAHDLLVHPGIWEEPLARVYIEALATGTPIVTSEYGDIDTVIGDGGVTTDGSVGGFVDTIATLIREDRLPEQSRGAKHTVDRYRKEHIIPQVEALYESII